MVSKKCTAKRSYLLLLSCVPAGAVNIGVVGAHGDLGRELVQQCRDRALTPTAFVRRTDDRVQPPVRAGWLSPDTNNAMQLPPFRGLNVKNALDPDPTSTLDAVVFALSGKPFTDDKTTEVVEHVCATLSPRCRTVCLVSAHGVGDSIDGANTGIQLMRSWYLQSTYKAKEEQETILATMKEREGENLSVLVVRPKVLSYDTIPLNPAATPRWLLARDILDWCEWSVRHMDNKKTNARV